MIQIRDRWSRLAAITLLAAAVALALAATASLLLAGSVSAQDYTKLTYVKADSYADCRAARYLHKIASTATTCSYKVTYGPITLRTYRVLPPHVTALSGPVAMSTTQCSWIETGCYNMPTPGKWYYADSYINTSGPGGLWWITTYYHIRTDGYTLEVTAPTTCETFGAGVSISVSDCAIHKFPTASGNRWEIGARWKECWVHPVFGFCSTKGSTMTVDSRTFIWARTSW